MKIYTKTGDGGETSLYGGRRVSKSIVRLEVVGCVDELNSILGIIVSKMKEFESIQAEFEKINADVLEKLEHVQNDLFQIGSDVATSYAVRGSFQKTIDRISLKQVNRLEREIDSFEKQLNALRYFILPGGHEIAALLQFARTVARRAERNAVRLSKGAKTNPYVLQYLNRLSDWLFVLARFVNLKTETEEIIWK